MDGAQEPGWPPAGLQSLVCALKTGRTDGGKETSFSDVVALKLWLDLPEGSQKTERQPMLAQLPLSHFVSVCVVVKRKQKQPDERHHSNLKML